MKPIERMIAGKTTQEAIEAIEASIFMCEMKERLTTQDYLFLQEAERKLSELKQVL